MNTYVYVFEMLLYLYDFPDDHRNVQIIYINGNMTVLTYCERTQLISFVCSREKEVNETEVSLGG